MHKLYHNGCDESGDIYGYKISKNELAEMNRILEAGRLFRTKYDYMYVALLVLIGFICWYFELVDRQ